MTAQYQIIQQLRNLNLVDTLEENCLSKIPALHGGAHHDIDGFLDKKHEADIFWSGKAEQRFSKIVFKKLP